MARPSDKATAAGHRPPARAGLAHPLARGLCAGRGARFLGRVPHAAIPGSRLRRAAGQCRCIQPRGGVPLFDAQLQLTQAAERGRCGLHPADDRQLYAPQSVRDRDATAAAQRGRGTKLPQRLPAGLPRPRTDARAVRGLDKPVSLRHGTPDARLLVEVAIASGIAEIEGGGICYCLPYSEGFPLDRALLYWQYVDRICAMHSTPRRPIHRESFGPLTATLVPPAIAIAIEIIEALLAAEQGVLSFAVSFGQTGSLFRTWPLRGYCALCPTISRRVRFRGDEVLSRLPPVDGAISDAAGDGRGADCRLRTRRRRDRGRQDRRQDRR